jgi:NTE family protein
MASPTDASARLTPLTAKRETSPTDVKPGTTRSPKDVSRQFVKPLLKSHRRLERPPFECIALVLQGGGALGAFQAGVYQGLAEANLQPDWVAGIPIGAINAALIAGNPPETRLEKLHAFWNEVTTQFIFDPFGIAHYWMRGDLGHVFLNRLRAGATLLEGAPGFFKPRMPPPYLAPPGTAEATSYYDTSPLRGTLERLVDFDRINAGEMRFSVGSVNIRTGNFVYFDSTTHKIRPEHIMASGALPPGCPAVEVDGELYWDGGLVSNTPLQWVVQGDTRQDTLAFQVDLWSSRGDLPSDLNDVTARQKEIQYSSRTRANTDQFKQIQCVRVALANVLERVPPEILDSEDGKLLKAVADRKVYNVVHLIYRSKNYEVQSKDYEFSRTSMNDHWNAGYSDAIRTLRHPEALQRPTEQVGVSTFDVAIDGRE